MKILPDEIPEDTTPLTEGQFVPPAPLRSSIKDLNEKNVFVSFFNKKSAVGRLTCETKTFYVGTADEIYFYSDVESFREV